jgi:hypothetical protein
MAEHYGDWQALTEQASVISTAAVELSALSGPELPGLLAFLRARPVLPFARLSVHAPAKSIDVTDEEMVDQLEELAQLVDAVVVHPDCIQDPASYRRLGTTLLLENLDRRKIDARTAEELDAYFQELPEAGLCLDVAHAHSVDPSLAAAHQILDRHGHRLRQLHVSSLDHECHHMTLTATDQGHFAPVLERCRDVPWILEAEPPAT